VTSHQINSRWFVSSGSELQSPARIFCFPHGGGNPRAYVDWQMCMGGTADIVAVCVPGRGPRSDERAAASIAELADRASAAIASVVDRPTYLFGHSLGGVVAFEVARRLRGVAALRHLVASGCAAPSLLPTDYLRWAAQLDGRAFAEAMTKFEGMSPEIVEDRELQELLLPDLRADCRLIAAYRYQPAAPLEVRLSLINGRDDWRVGNGMLAPWRSEVTTAPDYHWRDGGHFYFADRPAAVVDVLRAVVRAGSGEPAPADEHVELI
jgi:surfactin synthase thioesterase subunit